MERVHRRLGAPAEPAVNRASREQATTVATVAPVGVAAAGVVSSVAAAGLDSSLEAPVATLAVVEEVGQTLWIRRYRHNLSW